jgi:hypothetical protein
VSAGWPVTLLSPVAVPAPTVVNAGAGTLVTCRWTCAVVAALAPGAPCAGDWPSFTAISVATSAITATTLPPATSIRLRASARRSADRRSASLCRAFRALAFTLPFAGAVPFAGALALAGAVPFATNARTWPRGTIC